MKERKFYNLTYTVLAFLMASYGMLYKTILKLPPVDYAFYAMILILAAVYAIERKHFMAPRRYVVLLMATVLLMIVNAVVSKYSPPALYVAIGSAITIMPFVFFLVSYNFSMTDGEIYRFIQVFILMTAFFGFLLYVDSFILHTVEADYQNAVLSSGIVGFGAWASLANQAIIMCLAEYYRRKDKKLWGFIVFFAISIVLTNQLKAIFSLVVIFTVYIFYLTNIKKSIRVIILSVAVAILGVALSLSATFLLKFENYLGSYGDSETYQMIARPALYIGAFQISSDFFPLGSGQGTYGSVPVNMIDSYVYSDYELDKVWGLEDNSEQSFRLDTHWASILGEMGWLGLIFYLALLLYPARHIKERLKNVEEEKRRYYVFLIKMGVLVMSFESLFIPLPKNFAFIVAYAGLAGLILNRKETKTEEIQ